MRLRSYLKSIYNQFFNPEIIDENSIRASLMYVISSIGIVFLCILGSLAFLQKGYVLATADFTVAFLLICILFLLRTRGYLQFCIYAGMTIMFALFFYLFLNGGISRSAFVWVYTYPLFAFFLLGSRKGFLFSITFFCTCLGVLIVDLSMPVTRLYDLDLALRFIPSYIVVILFSLLYEIYRENSHKALLAGRATLEKKVDERTKALRSEVQIRKEKEQELRKSEARYRTLYDNSGDGISILDIDGHFISANLRFCTQVGFREAELQTMRPEDIYADRNAGELLKDVFTSGSAEFETTMVNRNGDHMPVEIRAQRIVFDDATAILYSSRDIAERRQREAENKQLQEKLHRASKMEAIGLMAGGIAHDLNNILAGVTGYPELMLLKLPQDSELRKPLTQVLQSGKRAAAVVTELLTMARGVASAKDPHDCNLLIENFLNTLEARRIIDDYNEVAVVTQLSKNTGRIPCSPIHFQKCIMNLLLNAVEVVGNKTGGTVEIVSFRCRPDSETLKRLHLKQREYVVVSVKDNGPGIAKEDIEHIFEPFYSRKVLDRSGTGLGLTVVWNVVTEHDGAIHVDSSSEGTSFNLYFPATDDVKVETTAQSITWSPSSKNILVVDDEPQLRDIADEMLSNCGYSVATVSSGEQAIEALKTSEYDLVLLDMMMAPGLNGRQTYEEIIKFRPKQKALIASGYSEDEEIKKVIALGVSGFIQKPYELNQLRLAVQKSMNPEQIH